MPSELAAIGKLLKGCYGADLVAVVLFGSRARGDATAKSDLDILVVLDKLERPILDEYRRAYAALAPLRSKHLCDTTILISDTAGLKNAASEPGALLLNIAFDGVLIHDEAGIAGRILRKVREASARAGLTRVRRGWGYEWVSLKAPPPGEYLRIRVDAEDPAAEHQYRLALAREHLSEAQKAFVAGANVAAVHEAQLAAENAAKAVIALFKPPSWVHDPAPELRAVLPEVEESAHLNIAPMIEELARVAEELAPAHALTSYGDIERGLTPSSLYTRTEAWRIVQLAEKAVKYAEEAISSWLQPSRSQ